MKKFCSRPFTNLEIFQGYAHFCCPSWLKLDGIEVGNKTVKELWNHPEAQQLRASILDNSFRYCKKDVCPFLSDQQMPEPFPNYNVMTDVKKITDPFLKNIIKNNLTILEEKPIFWNASHDQSCNLSCPSCRENVIMEKKENIKKQITFQERILKEIGKDLKYVQISGGGDPFASQAYLDLIKSCGSDEYPDLEVLLYSNGVLFNKKSWDNLEKANQKIKYACISIDGMSKEVFEYNRRGAKFETVFENLNFISQLRKEGKLKLFILVFVVQNNNYREMKSFIEKAEDLGVDMALFLKIINMGTYSNEQFKQIDIADSTHPDHKNFLQILKDPCFNKPFVGLGVLRSLRDKALV